ncbi:MAG: SLC13 family permease [Hyphomicrobiaceae bacterium]|nr:SLC13 family permease [Hyphomicrobiaceae bacterium]
MLGLSPVALLAMILAATLVLLVWGRWRHDLVAGAALTTAVLLGLVDSKSAFSGLSDPAVVTVALVLVLSASIRESGILDRVVGAAEPLLRTPASMVAAMTALTALLSAFMNNIGALAIIMPAAIVAAEKNGRPPAIVLMPIAFGSLLGGLITLIGTPPNLLISVVRREATGQPFAMFDFAPVGLVVAAAGVVYLAFAWRLLPEDRRGAPLPEQRFRIEDFVTEVRIAKGSSLIGKTVGQLETEHEVSLVSVIRGDVRRLVPWSTMTLQQGDVLVLEAGSATLKRVVDTHKLELVGSKHTDPELLTSDGFGIVEVVVTTNSVLIGRSPLDFGLRRYGVNLLAISRQGKRLTSRLKHVRFAAGDVLVLQGKLDEMSVTEQDLGCLPLAERRITLGRPVNVFLPALAMVAAVALTAFDVLPVATAFMAAVVVLGVLRVMPLNNMYAAIDWPVIVLLAALIPVTAALEKSGGTEVVAGAVASLVGGWPPVTALALFLIATLVVTPVLNNAATVLLMGPIAAGYAKKAGLSVDPFLMAVAIGASCDFLTPFGHQSNTLVYGPGGYKFGDYARLGLPLTLIVTVVGLPMILLAWPLKPA